MILGFGPDGSAWESTPSLWVTCVGAFNHEEGNPITQCEDGVVCAGEDGKVGTYRDQGELLAVAAENRNSYYIHDGCSGEDGTVGTYRDQGELLAVAAEN